MKSGCDQKEDINYEIGEEKETSFEVRESDQPTILGASALEIESNGNSRENETQNYIDYAISANSDHNESLLAADLTFESDESTQSEDYTTNISEDTKHGDTGTEISDHRESIHNDLKMDQAGFSLNHNSLRAKNACEYAEVSKNNGQIEHFKSKYLDKTYEMNTSDIKPKEVRSLESLSEQNSIRLNSEIGKEESCVMEAIKPDEELLNESSEYSESPNSFSPNLRGLALLSNKKSKIVEGGKGIAVKSERGMQLQDRGNTGRKSSLPDIISSKREQVLLKEISSGTPQKTQDLANARRAVDVTSKGLVAQLQSAAAQRKLFLSRENRCLVSSLGPQKSNTESKSHRNISESCAKILVKNEEKNRRKIKLTEDPYKPFVARPLPQTNGALGNGGQIGVPRVCKRRGTIPNSPKLGSHRIDLHGDKLRVRRAIESLRKPSIDFPMPPLPLNRALSFPKKKIDSSEDPYKPFVARPIPEYFGHGGKVGIRNKITARCEEHFDDTSKRVSKLLQSEKNKNAQNANKNFEGKTTTINEESKFVPHFSTYSEECPQDRRKTSTNLVEHDTLPVSQPLRKTLSDKNYKTPVQDSEKSCKKSDAIKERSVKAEMNQGFKENQINFQNKIQAQKAEMKRLRGLLQ